MAATPRRRAEERRSAPRRTVRGELALLAIVCVGIAAALVAGVAAWRQTGTDSELRIARLHTTAALVGAQAAGALSAKDPVQGLHVLRAAKAPGVDYARIERLDGAVLAETGVRPRTRAHATQVDAPILHDGRTVGRLVVVGPTDPTPGSVLASLGASLVAGLLASALALWVAMRAQRSIAGPIVALTQSIASLQDEQAAQDAADLAKSGEIGDLVHGFNRMLNTLRRREASIAALEGQVAAKTSALRTAQDAVDAAVRARSEVVVAMDHEIRAPVNGVVAMAEMLSAAELAPPQRRFAEAIAKSGATLLSSVNDMLGLTAAEAALRFETAPVDLAEVVEDVCLLFWDEASTKGLDLAAYVDPAVPARVVGDPVRLRQIVGVLVNNAIRLTKTGGVLIEVEADGPASIRVCVHDTGAGVAKDRMAQAFGAPELGLSLCRRVVEAMGGRFSFSSEVGRGSTFGFRLPVEALEPPALWPDMPGTALRAHLAVQGMSSRRALSRYLARAGFSVASGSGDRAVLRIADSASLAHQARDCVPTVCLAAYGDSAPHELKRCGYVQTLLAQPFRRSELAALLRQAQAGEPLVGGEDVASGEVEATPVFEGARILVADDSAVNREVAREALARLGVEAKLVRDGAEAVEAALSEAFDLILMDGAMPRMDGYAAAVEIHRLQAEMGRPLTPVIALTAHEVGAAAHAWHDAGMAAVLHRPFNLNALATALSGFLTPTSRLEPMAASFMAEAQLIDPRISAQLEAMAAGGRSEFVSRVYGLYCDNAPDSVIKLMDAATQVDLAACAKTAHELKSMSANIGAAAVAGLADEIETAALDGSSPNLETLMELQRLVGATLARLSGAAPAARSQPALAIPGADADLLAEMEKGLLEDEMSLAYQPQVDRDGERIIGVEALLRWTHPIRGPISPAVFIPVAERYGLIPRITDWVVERMLAETRYLRGLQVAFNASAIEFSEPDFVDRILAMIERHGYDPRRLEVEITETAILQNESAVRRNIDRLHELGMQVALDDFGAGYSSLGHLRRYPFDKLKIDREFITDCSRDMQAATIVHAVVSIGRALGMKVVAEGVETDTQRKFLKVAGVHAMQGYLFGKPISVDELTFLLSRKARMEQA